jgi:hypothetical protein
MSVRRVVTVAIAVVCSLVAAGAEEVLPVESISNWTAPPYWSPSSGKCARPASEGLGTLGAQAVEVIPSPPMPFVAINPCRIADTRAGQGFSGQAGPPALASNVTRTFQIGGTVTGVTTQCGIPLTAQAVSFQFTIIQPSAEGNLIAWPSGTAPTTSVLNWAAGIFALGNGIVVPVSDTGGVNVFVNAAFGASAHLTIDVNGYYAPVGIVNTLNGLSGAVTLAPGSNITITPAGQTLTIANTAPAAWSLTGNSGTTPGTNFLGTTDNQALELKVRNERVLRLEPTAQLQRPNVIGGSSFNTVTAGVFSATIGGGGDPSIPNRVTDDYGTVAGGGGNRAGDDSGMTNDRQQATVGGGLNNTASGARATVGGGQVNTAGGTEATVPGGLSNMALGDRSFAAGRRAQANHDGAFVWGDSTNANVASTGVNQFVVRASGGIWLGTTSSPSIAAGRFIDTSTLGYLSTGGVWTDNSDRDSKENFQEIDEREILSRVATLPITRWSYKAEGCEIEHLGPMAQDFSAAFGLGSDDRSISTLDSSGVALAAIQALYEEVQELRKRLAALEDAKD